MKKVLIALALAAAAAAAWHWLPRTGWAPDPMTYATTPVQRGNIVRTVTANGTLNPVVNVTVGCQISGTIAKLHADFNSVVKKGDLIAELDPATYDANVASAAGNVAQARAALEIARINEARQRELITKKVAAQSEYDKARTDLLAAEASLQVQEAALNRAKVDQSRCKIYAPIDGIVISRAVDVGQTVAASLNAPTLFTIANDLTKMQINANVAEADVGGVVEGQDVTFTVDAFPQETFTGKVVQIRNSPIIQDNVVNYDTVISVANPDLKLKPGMTANVSIVLARRDNILRVANAALRFRPPEGVPVEADAAEPGAAPRRSPSGDGRAPGRSRGQSALERTAYLAATDGGPLRPVRVKAGITDGVFTEILEGLKEGDQPVTAIKSGLPSAAAPASTNPLGGNMGPPGRRM